MSILPDPKPQPRNKRPIDSQPEGTHLTREVGPNPMDDGVRVALRAYKAEKELSNGGLAVRLGFSPQNEAIVSAYLSGKPRGNWILLQDNARDLLAKEQQRMASGLRTERTLTETPASRQLEAHLNYISMHRAVAMLYGDPGIGKSDGLELYRAKHRNTVVVVVEEGCKGVRELTRAVLAASGQLTKSRRVPRAAMVGGIFADAGRLIVFDNAEQLPFVSLVWIMNLWEKTRCPIALLGNPEIVEDTLSRNPKLSSRIGTYLEVKLAGGLAPEARGGLDEFAHWMVQMAFPNEPEVVAALREPAAEAIQTTGHARRLEHQLRHTHFLLRQPVFQGNPTGAFQAAATMLIRNQATDTALATLRRRK